MLYILYGLNSKKLSERQNELLDNLFDKYPKTSFIKIDDEDLKNKDIFFELTKKQDLFGSKTIILLKNILGSKDFNFGSKKLLGEIKNSENIFVLVENKISKTILDKLKEYAFKIEEFEGKLQKKEEFNIFLISDALGNRDKKKLWILFQQGLKYSSKLTTIEDIYNILFWQMKNILLVGCLKKGQESGLKPFVFKKTQSFSKNYTVSESKLFLSKLVSIYHENRRGNLDFKLALEEFILGI